MLSRLLDVLKEKNDNQIIIEQSTNRLAKSCGSLNYNSKSMPLCDLIQDVLAIYLLIVF